MRCIVVAGRPGDMFGRMRNWIVLLGLCACGDDGGITPHDGAPRDGVTPDMAIDAEIDAPIDAPPPPPGHYHYVLDHVQLPTTNTQARDYALDLNNDNVVDNQFGMVMATFETMGIPISPAMNEAVDRGTSITLLDLAAASFTTDPAASASLFAGENPSPAACAGNGDTTCRHHLAGTASFTAAATPSNPPLTGAFVAGTFTGGPGQLALPLAWPGGSPFRLPLIGARMQLRMASASGISTIIIGGAIAQADIDGTLLPRLRDSYAASVSADCSAVTSPPTCGCTPGSNGRLAIDLFDGDDGSARDCKIDLVEIQQSSLIQALFAPDVQINGVAALSVGVGATAVPGAFTPP